MKKLKATILSFAALSALTFAGAAGLYAQNQPLTASAETPIVELISPTDYQQYLPLLAPTAVTATNDYTAIADGSTIYVYDAADKLYREYVHADAVAQLLFDADNNLYFLSEYKLWKIAASDLKQASPTPTDLNIVCPGFTVQENCLYYSTMSKKSIKRYDLTTGATDEFPLESNLQDSSPLAFGKGKLYCVCESESGYSVFEIDPDSKNTKPLASFDQRISSIAIANNLFCVVTKSGAFRVYNINNLNGTPIMDTALDEADIGGYVAAYAKGDDVYVIRGNSVRVYDTETQAFTDFEINAASSSPHRLDGANNLYLSKNKLFIADDGNDRISVYNTTNGTFEKAITSTLPSPFLSSYGETLLVSSAQEAALYSLKTKGYGEALLSISTEEINGNVVGATCVYDRYYLLTDGGYCYTLTQTGDAWGYVKTQTLPYATAITADVYGSLYVLYDDGDIHQFTEREFTTPNASGTKILELESETAKLSIDYEGNLYALSGNVLTKYSLQGDSYALDTTFSPLYDLVKDDSPSLLSFAFGVENEYTYFLYENNYLVKSDELQIPTVNPILVGEAADRLFGADNRDFALVQVHKDAILTEFDFAALQGADKFPYLAFERCYSPMTALKIGEENGHAILAISAGATGYKTYLVEDGNYTVLPETDYRIVYTDKTQTGTLTNGVSLYKFPYLSSLLTITDIPRGAMVTLLGEITQLDHAYYEISYTTENGETLTGYIPKNYVLLFDGSFTAPETITYGNTEDDTDAVWRLTYILLGLAAIGILTDFLLLYKSKKSNNE